MTAPPDARPGKGFTLFLLGLTLLGSGAVPVFLRFMLKPGANGGLGLDPWIVNALRYASAPVFWLPFVLVRGRNATVGAGGGPASAGAPAAGVWKAAVIPAAFNLLTQTCWGVAGCYADANVIAFISRLAFPFTVLYCFLLFPGERRLARTPAFWIGGAGSLCGLVLLSAERLARSGGGGTTPFGFFLLVVMAVSWGGYSVSVKKQMSRYPSIMSFWVVSTYTTAGLLLLMGLFGDLSTVRAMDRRAWAVLAASSLAGITFWHVMYYHALKGVGAIVADGVLMVSPFLTVAGSAYLLGETLSALQTVGGSLLVASGVLLVVAHGRAAAGVGAKDPAAGTGARRAPHFERQGGATR